VIHAEDDRSPTAKALSKVSHITSISLMMIIPAIIGYFVDQRLGTLILFTVIGLAIGMSASIWQLVKFVAFEDQQADSDQEGKSGE
jgi:F0F1-type ATP synthase assembly protein I